MPVLITSGRKFVRSKNDKTTGVNGYVGSSMANGTVEISGFLVDDGSEGFANEFPYTVDVTSSGASGGDIIERASMSAKYGERVNFSVTALKLGDYDTLTNVTGDLTTTQLAAAFPSLAAELVVGTANLGLTSLWCDITVTEFSTNFSLSYAGPACEGKIKVNGVSGSRTGYGAANTVITESIVTENPDGIAANMNAIPEICPGATYETTEFGEDYSPEEGVRGFCTQEIMSVTGVPWDTYYGEEEEV